MMDKKTKNALIYYVNLSAACFSAFAAGFAMIPQSGFMQRLPFAVIFTFICAGIKYNFLAKLAFVATFSYALPAFFNSGKYTSLLNTTFCVLIFLVATAVFYLIKKKKALPIVAAVLMIMSTMAAHAFVFGNPFESFSAQKEINKYIDTKYTKNDVIVENFRYVPIKNYYYMDICAKNDVTNVKQIVIHDKHITDFYMRYVEQTLMIGRSFQLKELLHQKFPTANFTVAREYISSFPDKITGVFDTSDYTKRMHFGIYISNQTSDDDFLALCKKYMHAISRSFPELDSITFYGGSASVFYKKLEFLNTLMPFEPNEQYVSWDFLNTYIQDRNSFLFPSR